jgi:hypothetical protein
MLWYLVCYIFQILYITKKKQKMMENFRRPLRTPIFLSPSSLVVLLLWGCALASVILEENCVSGKLLQWLFSDFHITLMYSFNFFNSISIKVLSNQTFFYYLCSFSKISKYFYNKNFLFPSMFIEIIFNHLCIKLSALTFLTNLFIALNLHFITDFSFTPKIF